MNIAEYFNQAHTPAPGSPVGTLMVKVLAKFPGMDFDTARAEANKLLDMAAGRKNYQTPKVLSDAEKAEQRERLKTAWNPASKQLDIFADAA